MEKFGQAGTMPSYRAMLDREGLAEPADAALIGDEAVVEKELQRYADAGATEFQLCPIGTAADQARTIELFGEIARTSAL
jgi:alkanesulfonate monooxygenase SsuD/methylene tetrahydromethanopterin reductase-like flavin-dependent oxidoreductase (luciferase family)